MDTLRKDNLLLEKRRELDGIEPSLAKNRYISLCLYVDGLVSTEDPAEKEAGRIGICIESLSCFSHISMSFASLCHVCGYFHYLSCDRLSNPVNVRIFPDNNLVS